MKVASNLVEIRCSTEDDFAGLVELNNLIWNETNTPLVYTYSSIEEYSIRNPAGSEFVAIIDNKVAGYIKGIVNPLRIPANQHVMELDMGVHPNFQGKSVGGKLMDFLFQQAFEQGVEKMSLRVLASNDKGVAFYKKQGFVEQGRLKNEFLINGSYVDDILMYKLLKA